MGPNPVASQTPTASVPTASTASAQQPAAASMGLDILNSLVQQKAAAIQEQQRLAPSALVPTPGYSAGTSPGLMLSPLQHHGDAPLIQKPTVGARATRAKGISNIIIGASNLVGKYQNKVEADKQRALAVDLERTFQSVQGIQEAEQVIKNPNATPAQKQAAQEAINKNQGIIDALLNDPKKRKDIGKALDINFVDPTKNNTMEHGALKAASSSFAKQLQDQIPANMQINPEAIAQLQMVQAREKSIDEMIKAVAPAAIRAEGEASLEGSKESNQRFIAASKIYADAQKTQAELDGRYRTAIDAAKTRGEFMLMGRIYTAEQAMNRLKTGLKLREQLIEQRGLSGNKAIAALQRSLQLAIAGKNQAQQMILHGEALRDAKQKELGVSTYNRGDHPILDNYNDSIHSSEVNLKTFQDMIDSTEAKLKTLGGKPVPNGNIESNSKSAGGKTSITKSASIQTTGPVDDSSSLPEVDDSDLYGIEDDNSEK